jgi:hypothetical protein
VQDAILEFSNIMPDFLRLTRRLKASETLERGSHFNESMYMSKGQEGNKEKRNRRLTKIGLRACRPTRSHRARRSRPVVGLEKSIKGKFGTFAFRSALHSEAS